MLPGCFADVFFYCFIRARAPITTGIVVNAMPDILSISTSISVYLESFFLCSLNGDVSFGEDRYIYEYTSPFLPIFHFFIKSSGLNFIIRLDRYVPESSRFIVFCCG